MNEKEITDTYHHGDLRRALIEAGISIINEEGEEKLSLRKVAASCGVSHAAPYAHFKNKEELLEAMKAYVTDAFMQELQGAVEKPELSIDESVIAMGKAYVLFFYHHPEYYRFMFTTPFMSIRLTTEECGADTFPPYRLFQQISLKALRAAGYREESLLNCMVNMWATVQGLSCIATMPNVTFDEDWEAQIENIIKNQ